jgi:hypothetical protein
MGKPNQYHEAFKEGYNVVGLASAVALSAALLNPIPLIAGVVAEAAYLLTIPDSKWYEKRLSKRYDAEVEKRRQEIKDRIIPTLRPEIQQRYARLEQTRKAMESSPMQNETWFREVLRKLDYLLEKFLQFAAKDAEYENHIRNQLAEVRGVSPDSVYYRYEKRGQSGKRQGDVIRIPVELPADQASKEIVEHYGDEMADIQKSVDAEQDDDTKAILAKRLDILKRRQELVGKLSKILTNLEHQMDLVEDTFGLTNDEIRARSPEQILADIDDVVLQTDTMVQVLEELAPYEQMAARLSA